MYDELTEKDIEKMREELEDRILNQRPVLIEEVKRCREFGDLSENYEYKEAKRARGRNESRIRYLQSMIKTARIISDDSVDGMVGLYDKVGVFMEDDGSTEYFRVVTTVRTDPLSGHISKESPLGKVLLGAKVGDRLTVEVNPTVSYCVVVRSIERGEDDGSAQLMSY